jgi:hypothetical protein
VPIIGNEDNILACKRQKRVSLMKLFIDRNLQVLRKKEGVHTIWSWEIWICVQVQNPWCLQSSLKDKKGKMVNLSYIKMSSLSHFLVKKWHYKEIKHCTKQLIASTISKLNWRFGLIDPSSNNFQAITQRMAALCQFIKRIQTKFIQFKFLQQTFFHPPIA